MNYLGQLPTLRRSTEVLVNDFEKADEIDVKDAQKELAPRLARLLVSGEGDALGGGAGLRQLGWPGRQPA